MLLLFINYTMQTPGTFLKVFTEFLKSELIEKDLDLH